MNVPFLEGVSKTSAFSRGSEIDGFHPPVFVMCFRGT